MRTLATALALLVALVVPAAAQPTAQSIRVRDAFIPLVECARARALELAVSSGEAAEAVARAAVGLCSREYGAYSAAVFDWDALPSVAQREGHARRNREKVIDMALTLIVSARSKRK